MAQQYDLAPGVLALVFKTSFTWREQGLDDYSLGGRLGRSFFTF